MKYKGSPVLRLATSFTLAFALTAAPLITKTKASISGAMPIPQGTRTKECSHLFGWDSDCLAFKLQDPAYFDIDFTQATHDQLRVYIDKNQQTIAALLMQIDYGRDVQRFYGPNQTDIVLNTESQKDFLGSLSQVQAILDVLQQMAAALNAFRDAPVLNAVSESASAIGTVLQGAQIAQLWAQLDVSQEMRGVFDTYFLARLDPGTLKGVDANQAWNILQASGVAPVLDRIRAASGIAPDRINDVRVWLENAFIAYRLVGYSDSDDLRRAEGRAIAHLANPVSREVVLASFQWESNSAVLVPFLIYDGSRYVPLTRGVGDPSVLNFTPGDLLHPGAVNPDSPRVAKALQQSVLNTFKDFDLYRNSSRVGHFTVTRVSVIYFNGGISDSEFKVVGSGVASGLEPSFDLAVAGITGPGDFSCSGLTPALARQARSLALGLIPRVMPRLDSWPGFSGKAILLGKPDHESASCFDLRRDGDAELSLELTIPFKSPGDHEGQFSAHVYLFARYERSKGKLKTLLSSVSISGEGSAESYRQGSRVGWLLGAVDIDGDGIAELLLFGDADIQVYELRPEGLFLVCEVRNYWTLSDY